MKLKIWFSGREIKEIIISTLVLGFAFFYPGLGLFSSLNMETLMLYFIYVVIIAFAFIPHELAHKFVAIRYGCFSEYRMWKTGLKFALLMAFITNGGFVMAAPGAVVISTTYMDLWGLRHIKLSRKQHGYIAAAGPVANLFIALLFILIPLGGISSDIARVSAFLAFFNLMPIPPLDGSKVFAWDRKIWAVLIISALLIMINSPIFRLIL